WNDANNALVGNGVSMVTLYYLRRFLKFFQTVLSNSERKEVSISAELLDFFEIIKNTFSNHSNLLNSEVSDTDRKVIVDGLGQAGSAYREQIYNNGFSGNKQAIALQIISQFVDDCLKALEQSIRVNKREDNLYHAYNLLTIENEKEISISYLSEMLEGQVAVLSSGYLSGEEALQVLDAMKKSALFRDDQYSYLLYPNKQLPGFLEKNTIDGDTIQQSELLKTLDQSGIAAILDKDIHGNYHFNGNFKNANDVEAALDDLANSEMADLVAKDRSLVLQIFEDTFNHKAFTGRSGTFYGYEGLGSIYWHMVSKLQLAVQECCLKAIAEKENEEVIGRLLEHYYEINEGIGVHKSPSLYGAFPTDPYSHTPAGKGAQQPGMTGQVKEDILSRYGELGIFVKQGRLYFDPCLLRKNEFLQESKLFDYVDVNSAKQQIQIDQGSLCFTYCQVPVIYQLADNEGVEVIYKNNDSKKLETLILDAETSNQIFQRTGVVSRIMVQVKESELR
ncbi:MAG: hypothetical protein KJP00_10055, partial [Bacteroidia bacterium]|nr:hypothetical protein [Bacteroidia bacterium]